MDISKVCCVVIMTNGLVDEVIICANEADARKRFLDECSTRLSNWSDYTDQDMDVILDAGYAQHVSGSITLIYPVIDKM